MKDEREGHGVKGDRMMSGCLHESGVDDLGGESVSLFTSGSGRSHVGEASEKKRPLLLHPPGEERAVKLNAAAVASRCFFHSGLCG